MVWLRQGRGAAYWALQIARRESAERGRLPAARGSTLQVHRDDLPQSKDPTSDLEIQSKNLPQSNLDCGKYSFESLGQVFPYVLRPPPDVNPENTPIKNTPAKIQAGRFPLLASKGTIQL